MAYVAATARFFALRAYLARDLSYGWPSWGNAHFTHAA